jgi:hypothetical protein
MRYLYYRGGQWAVGRALAAGAEEGAQTDVAVVTSRCAYPQV